MNTSVATANLYHILDELVKIPSTTGNFEASDSVIAYVKNLLQPAGVHVSTGKFNGFPYLVATSQPINKDMIWFISHLDVVPAEQGQFTLRQDAANCYGRGVFDMKGMAAAVLAAFLQRMPDEGRNVGLMFTTDEEIGGRNGVGALVGKNTNFAGAAAFVFDQSADWVMQEKMKGILWLEATATGQAAHGARPWLGKSANSALVAFLADLQTWYKTHMPQTAPYNYYTTLNLGTLHGGQATNQVSGKAVATIDIRFTDESDAQAIIRAARQLAKKQTGLKIHKLLHDPCVNTDTTSPWYQRTLQIMDDLHIVPGKNGEVFGHGSTDGRYLAPYNFPVISVRPPGGNQHAEGEWASKRGLEELMLLCARVMQNA